MNGIQSQSVEMIIAQPHQRVVDKETPYLGASPPVQVYGRTPGCVIVLVEVWPEFAEVVSNWAQVVIHHVQQHGEPFLVGRVYETLQPIRAAVGVVRRIEIDPVVTPPPRAG